MTNNIVVEGKAGIRVEVVLHSISEAGKEIITFLVDHPRIVHAEELKHRQFSYSAASSRAIPSAKMAEQLTGMPVSFGKNQGGMQAGEEHSELVQYTDADFGYTVMNAVSPQRAWEVAKENAIRMSNAFADAGYHKQVYNRLTEPFQMIRVLVTATETDNFYWLRNDKAADPTLQEQARCMQEAHKLSTPQVLKAGQYHLPFVESLLSSDDSGLQYFYEIESAVGTTDYLSLEDAIKVSCARCAATSFRNENYGLEKSLQVYDRLVNGDKVHAGALEHCATPMEQPFATYSSLNDGSVWQDGVSHMDKDGFMWSGNFKGFIQYRKTIPNECYSNAQAKA
jgi:hypothetical protein